MANIILRNVCKRYEREGFAVKNVNLEIEEKEFLILVGPSGCGKSTTLRMIAGLEEISDGELWIDDELVNFVDPKERDLAMVFQNYALYPHMSVFDNLAFSLSIRKVPKKEIKKRVEEVARMLEISHLLKRRPADLSGGQKQRVAIGSAIIRKPKAFLMDEPLSNLDAKLRNQMRVELAKLHKTLGTTTIYVTHDQTEAMTLGTRIVVMKDGIVQQVATPEVLYNNPANMFVAGFIGSPPMNFIKGMVRDKFGMNYIAVYEAMIPIREQVAKSEWMKHYENRSIYLGVRPEDIRVNRVLSQGEIFGMKGHGDDSLLKGQVVAKELLGAETLLYVTIGQQQYCAKVEPDIEAKVGDVVALEILMDRVKFFDEDTQENLLYVK